MKTARSESSRGTRLWSSSRSLTFFGVSVVFFGAMILWGLLAIRVESTMTGSIRYDDGAWRLEATEWSRAVVAYRRVAADGTVGDRQPITGLTPQRTRVVLDDFAAPERQRFDVILIFEADSLGRLLWRWVVR